MSGYILEVENVTKEFPGVRALDKVWLRVKEKEIHGVVGENGAGKSTLMKILSGVYPAGAYEGVIKVAGEVRHFKNIKESQDAGIAIIYQELLLVDQLSIAENIFLGRVDRFVNREKMNSEAQKWMEYVGLKEDPETLVGDIGVGKKQLVEITKALSKNAKLLILDEPSAALTDNEVDQLMNILSELKNRGVTCIYISHKLEEILRITDTVTVFRDGQTIGENPTNTINENKIISMMVGRDFAHRFPPRIHCEAGETLLAVKNLNLLKSDGSGRHILKDISFEARAGEILGLAGLMGSGRTELVNCIFGNPMGIFSGEIYIKGKKRPSNPPWMPLGRGLGF